MITIDFTEISGHILVPVAYGQALIDTGSPGASLRHRFSSRAGSMPRRQRWRVSPRNASVNCQAFRLMP
ncbi:hypothetical protein [Chlorobium phaeovibrioides]|uniref:hypothetical protein n=1 Tax=Chlorobium phaeovibrioides TaxID=1094 RepID=UPI001CE3F141|nr:hypothetical protein [Chlorobium phaeovibrioides]